MKILVLLLLVSFCGCATHKGATKSPEECMYECVMGQYEEITDKSWRDTLEVANKCLRNCEGVKNTDDKEYCVKICRDTIDNPDIFFDKRVKMYTEIRLEECKFECKIEQ